MKLKTIATACLISALSAAALPALAQDKAASEAYAYGTHPDIKHVVSLSEDSGQTCGLVNAQINYLDSMGDQRALTYLKHAASCNNEGN
ncbi:MULTISPECIES: DUF2790 domain-containing protein [unclassified Pseudomonas]|uniref:DUF2790 domain-containing protein n=1 Tax=unclassified Pseudomonas TaxID=196821 RepID=UPI001199A66B|nr:MULTISPECIES: DUF2790 domain-containing protein [unclassified Pseudomonas]TWC06712.1 uncharacterized protein DUF2790 [Pseudomonas sp. SJZ075]TWC20886.1 uncharacterized protein DUF2790 [Pseudomonas sp. SJZ074]TWC26851.1 uncharacterized protein DUF2790 [Pseudomonas sp. SJZ078]TWC38451.1 uncharacterized protein DUF2790 [Pseudomonas sp. SJZ085]TWC45497.1 uncharacterized protein DUF2790 [Pseudomonas sp. SJZ124]